MGYRLYIRVLQQTLPVSDSRIKHHSYFHSFQSDIDGIALPTKFGYPLSYVPHKLALIAASELQHYLETQTDWQHSFGSSAQTDGDGDGKMFGVLVVKNSCGELGYLNAVSGKLAGHNQHQKFVPPVFDILPKNSFFRKGEAIISDINRRLEELENAPSYQMVKNQLRDSELQAKQEIDSLQRRNREQKQNRHLTRLELQKRCPPDVLNETLQKLNKQSIDDHYALKQLKIRWKDELAKLEGRVHEFQIAIDALKQERKNRSSALQDEIFQQYSFVNKTLERKSLGDIFKHTPEGKPMAGAGECAAPKLLQYAFLHHLEPIALAEFWWGQSPKTEVRIHGHYYPACRGKCEPILGHMLQGMDLEDNPMLQNPAEGKELSVLWEDDYLVAVNKPHEFLSVPGKKVEDSVLSRLRERYPNATGPLVVHRLDMSTSGILLAAKSLEVYIDLQRQFSNREIKKRYVAILDGSVPRDSGFIDLPLRVDLDDRPRQLVCYEHGKPAQTSWEVVDRKDGKTRVHFYPITGRTHQLRVHAAHVLGLSCPIVGDELYGKRSNRLHLHAERIEFRHPLSGEWIVIEASADF